MNRMLGFGRVCASAGSASSPPVTSSPVARVQRAFMRTSSSAKPRLDAIGRAGASADRAVGGAAPAVAVGAPAEEHAAAIFLERGMVPLEPAGLVVAPGALAIGVGGPWMEVDLLDNCLREMVAQRLLPRRLVGVVDAPGIGAEHHEEGVIVGDRVGRDQRQRVG